MSPSQKNPLARTAACHKPPGSRLFGSKAAEPVLQCEELRFQVGQGAPQLGQFFFGTVNFQTRNFSDLQGFLQQRAYVVEMGQHSLGIFIALTAKSLVTGKTESVVMAFGLRTGFLNKPL